jgi:serine/threonine-protein kinase
MAEALTKAGRYQIVGELGRGSMGVVYEGYDPIIGRTVAIKTMLTQALAPQEFQEYKERFQREARAAGKLSHPNIITVYDFGEDAGVLYLAMEFLVGKSLDKIVEEQGVLPIETILPIYDQICSALDHAHQNKIVHRDIKPANIMVLQNGLVKVTDFGIAKMIGLGMTQAGQVLGTPNYMSPEQVKGRQIDGRSDIFSLGVILYELVTGEKPFGGRNITTVIYKIINENPVPPREFDASIHAGLSYVITKALAKNVEERYQTCRELAEDLRNYQYLGGATVGQSTVVMRATRAPVTEAVPAPPEPMAPPEYLPPEPVAPAVDETAITPPVEMEMIPPPAPQRRALPQIAWVLGALLVALIMGAIAYLVVLRPQGQINPAGPASVAQPPVAQSVQPVAPKPPTAPVVTTPVGTTPVVTTPPVTPPTNVANPEPTPPKTAEISKAVTPRARTPETKIGQLMVSANVNGARISVDGRSDPSWVTPHTIPDLPAGAHNILISMEGYDSYQQSVTIVGGQTSSVVGSLSSPSAELDLVTVPAGVEVVIDGKSYGASPVHATLPPGEHTYTLKAPGLPPYEKKITLTSGHVITRTVTLGEATVTGIVEVRTIPPGATVLADGSPVGAQTPTSFRLTVGAHTLVISLSGYRPIQRQVTVSASETTPVNINLTNQ